jgi:hypothetical protein
MVKYTLNSKNPSKRREVAFFACQTGSFWAKIAAQPSSKVQGVFDHYISAKNW